MKRKFSSMFLAVVMILTCMLPIAVSAENAEYTGAKPITVLNSEGQKAKSGDVYSISNAEELIAFSALAAANDYFRGCTVILTADIDLNPGWTAGAEAPSVTWTPVPDFWGDFDGQGHTISGLYKKGGDWIGLFSYVQYTNNYGDDVTIKNLNINNSYFDANGKKYAAVLIGYLGNGKNPQQNTYIQNVNMSDSCYSVGAAPGNALYIGEYAGPGSAKVTFENCIAKGKVNTAGNFVGGFIATSWRGYSFKNCVSFVDVTGGDQVAAFVGRSEGAFKKEFANCVSAASVKSVGKDSNIRIGGFIGYQNNGIASLTDCVNISNISSSDGKAIIGGFVGQSLNVVESYFTRCVHLGTTKNDGNSYNTNAFIGRLDAVTANASSKEIVLTDCYYEKLPDPYSRAIGGYIGQTGTNILRLVDTANNVDLTYNYSANDASAWNNYKARNDMFVKNIRKAKAELTGVGAVATMKAYNFVNAWEIHTAAGYPVPKSAFDISGMNTVPQKNGVDLLGVQNKAVEDGKFAVRFVATVDSTEYTAVGFDIKVAYNGQVGAYKTATTNTVYDRLIIGGYEAKLDGNGYFSIDGAKLAAQRVEAIPATGTVIFEVNSFSVQGAGEEAKTVADDVYVFIYQDGALVRSYIR